MNGPGQEHRIRIVLLDESGLLRASLARFLAAEPGFEVEGECGSAAEALEVLRSSPPDVVLLDFQVGNESGSDFLSAAVEAGYQGRFLIVTGTLDVRKSALALRLGASGIFLKSEAPERLLQAIKVVANGGVWVDPRIIQLLAERAADQYPRPEIHDFDQPLDERERNVLHGIVGGLSNRKIGGNIGISESSVKNVVQRLFSKAGVRTRSQLVRAALEGGTLSDPRVRPAAARGNGHRPQWGEPRQPAAISLPLARQSRD